MKINFQYTTKAYIDILKFMQWFSDKNINIIKNERE